MRIKKTVIPLIMLLEFGDYATKIPLQAISENSRDMPKNFRNFARGAPPSRPLVVVVAMLTK